MAIAILRTIGELDMDKSLFFMDPKRLNTSHLPIFYKNLFKVWGLFKVQKVVRTTSVFWLLKEPLVYGTRVDLTCNSTAMSEVLLKSHLFTFGQLLDVAGVDFKKCENVASVLNIRSKRVVSQLLQRCCSSLTANEKTLLKGYFEGKIWANESDPFPNLMLTPEFGENTGHFLDDIEPLSFYGNCGRVFHNVFVKIFHQKGLKQKVDTPWRTVLGLGTEVKPEWRALYKPPLAKRIGDLQWRIIHGIIAVNAFIFVLNRETSQNCPFCFERETVFHAFMHCSRLVELFNALERVFFGFNETFSDKIFIFGFRYVKKYRTVCQLLNFILGQAKMAIYLSRKNKVENGQNQDVVMVFAALIKSRLQIDFHFYKATENVTMFESIWCVNGVLCSVVNDELSFSHL